MAEETRILLFGGTSEGRELAEWLSARGSCEVYASTLTEYGGSLVEGLPRVRSLTGRMLPERMAELLADHAFACVVDATHPYAAGVSASIAEAARESGTPLVRVLREGEPSGPWTGVASAEEAARHVARAEGRVLLTTGSKDLPVYAREVADYRERLFVRILPVAASLACAADLGIPASHVIAMQGPFSTQLNCALIREFDIATLVTKASGAAGGFWEKVEAARECACELVVIHRPPGDDEGLPLEDAKRELARTFGV